MNVVQGFWESLGNKYTSALVALLTGFIIGQSAFGRAMSIGFGLMVGVVFAVVSLLVSTFLETIFPESIVITINIKSIFTIALLVLFFAVVTSAPSIDRLMSTVSESIMKARTSSAR